MQYLNRDGVALAYEDAGRGSPPLLLVHGFGGNHTNLQAQFDHFRRDRRVVAVDRRGHGASDKPAQEYTIAGFADDLAWTCRELGLYRPVVVVHSQGGIALELAARYPDVPAALVLLDAPVLPPAEMRGQFQWFLGGLQGPEYREVVRGFAEGAAFLPTDDAERKVRIVDEMCSLPRHVLVSTWENYLAHDEAAAAARCRVPVLLIKSIFAADSSRLQALCPQLVVGQTVGAGHFHQLEVADQVNPMIERFVSVALATSAPVPTANGGR